MNLPNKLTMLRIIIIPVMIIISCISFLNEQVLFANISIANFINLILFMLASFTDFLDGNIARKRNLVTTFGKFADPLADKMLVFTAMIILLEQGVIPDFVVILILMREFIVTGVRLVAVEHGTVIAASKLGKLKTATTMLALIVLFLFQSSNIVLVIGLVFIYIALALTIISGVEYFYKNRQVIFESI